MAIAEWQVSFAELLNEGISRCHRGETIISVAHDLARREIDPEVELHLLGLGIARVLNQALETERESIGGPAGPVFEPGLADVRAPASLNPNPNKLMRMYASADGTRKALLLFNRTDWTFFRDQAVGQSRAWAGLASVGDLAIAALERTGRLTTKDLPERDQKALRDALP